VLEIRKLRGRGYGYGVLSNGFVPSCAEVVAVTPLLLSVAQGSALDRVESLLLAVEEALATAVDPAEAEFLRLVHARWREDSTPDAWFRDLLFDGDLEPLDVLMATPRRPQRLTWCALSAAALDIIPNRFVAGGW